MNDKICLLVLLNFSFASYSNPISLINDSASNISQIHVTKEKVDSEINDEIYKYGNIIAELVHSNIEKYEGGKLIVSKEFPLRVKCGSNFTEKKKECPFEYQNIKGVLEIGDDIDFSFHSFYILTD